MVTKNQEEYNKIVDTLSKISGISKDDAEECIRMLNQDKRFCNVGIKISNSSAESIEENIHCISSLNQSLDVVIGKPNSGSFPSSDKIKVTQQKRLSHKICHSTELKIKGHPKSTGSN